MKPAFAIGVIGILCFGLPAWGSVPEVQVLLNRISMENRGVEDARIDVEYKGANVQIAESRLYPRLTFTSSLSRSKREEQGSTLQQSGVPGTSAAVGTPTATDLSSRDNWSLQISATYELFSRLAVVESVKQAKYDEEAARLELLNKKDGKKSDLLQALIEWQWLTDLSGPLAEAQAAMTRVRAHSKRQANLLYSSLDRANLKIQETELEYNATRVKEGLTVVEAALHDLLPSIDDAELERVPRFRVDYELPKLEEIRDRYVTQSRDHAVADLKVMRSESRYRDARWNRPWIPSVSLNGEASRIKGLDGAKKTRDSWSMSVTASFDLFDGFQNDGYRNRAFHELDSQENRRLIEASQNSVILKYRRMKALVAKAEFGHKDALAEKKRLRMEDVQKKFRQGVATRLEKTLTAVDYTKHKLDALDALKEYQGSILEIAVKLNEWDKVQIYETENAAKSKNR